MLVLHEETTGSRLLEDVPMPQKTLQEVLKCSWGYIGTD